MVPILDTLSSVTCGCFHARRNGVETQLAEDFTEGSNVDTALAYLAAAFVLGGAVGGVHGWRTKESLVGCSLPVFLWHYGSIYLGLALVSGIAHALLFGWAGGSTIYLGLMVAIGLEAPLFVVGSALGRDLRRRKDRKSNV